VAERLVVLPPNGNNGEHHIVPTPSEYRAKIEARRVVARDVFDALCAQYPDKYVALIQPRDVLDDPRDDLTVAKTAE
jgi:hypothetical protein